MVYSKKPRKDTGWMKKMVSLILAFAMMVSLIPASAISTAKAATNVLVKVYFDNNYNVDNDKWGDVYLYAAEGENWDLLTSGWPGDKLSKNKLGYYEYQVNKSTATALNMVFNAGDNNDAHKTTDITISASKLVAETDGVLEIWVDGYGNTSYTAPAGTGGPSVNGNQVTFTYTNSSASNVYVAGTMNNWNATAKKMTKSGSTFTCTMTLEPGAYEYKYVVDGNWVSDPNNSYKLGPDKNTVVVVEGFIPVTLASKKSNTVTLPQELTYVTRSCEVPKKVTYTSNTSGVTVSGTIATISDSFTGDSFNLTATSSDSKTTTVTVNFYEQQPVTVKIHYDRSDNKETEWDAYVWSDNLGSEGCQLTLTGSEYVATYVIGADNVAYTNKVNFIMRKGNWLAQEDTRVIDLSNVVAGTVHAYVRSDGSYSVDLSDATLGAKINLVKYNRSNNTIVVTTSGEIAVANNSFTVKNTIDGATIPVTDINKSGNNYIVSLGDDISSLECVTRGYKLTFDGITYNVTMPNLYDTEEFEEAYEYTGNDLGAAYTSTKTTFKVWAPTADSVNVVLYSTGSDEETGAYGLGTYGMRRGEKGVWYTSIDGDLKNVYYEYHTTVQGITEVSVDPYARATGVNGKRAMVIDLDSTDPIGWDNDVSPNVGMSYTDAIIYELHVRDLSINEESGVKDEWKGKFLGLTEKGTTNKDGIPTGLDHIKDLGVTHIHLLPSYDFGSIDETMSEEDKAANPDKQFNWGYDPVNYNVPEGSYSTDPYNGDVRVREMKQMVMTLHENNINVIMDVVYNHVQDAGTFGFNEIVPDYFSRTNADGSYSNGSGCGNDTASERAMVRKYIVDSVKYWADEYHIDGFRFDLVGLLDAETINEIVEEVHKTHPYVIFYGEGWTMGTAVKPSNTIMATQQNAKYTPGFAYFSDTFRDFIKGKDGDVWGYIQGATEGDQEGTLMSCFTANTSWIVNPTQVINYASCHDNYTLMDKINATRGSGAYAASLADRAKMNNLAAAIYLTAEGIPLIHAGEEMLRTKVDNNGNIIHNSYNVPDYVNSLKWGDLDSTQYQQVRDYYKGLIEFRKNHAALRLTTKTQVNNNVTSKWVADNVVMFKINGHGSISAEVADEIVVIFNSNNSAKTFSIYDHGASNGTWNICVNDKKAGTDVLGTVTNGQVTVPAISALILVKGALVDNNSVYLSAAVGEKGNVVVKYVDESGKSIAEDRVVRGFVGENYVTTARDIDGYTIKTTPDNLKGIYTAEDIIVTYVYKKKTTGAVTGFSYSARNNNSITLKWTKLSSATGYVIEQYKGGKWTVIKTVTSNATTSYKVTGLSASTKYQFRIRAYNKYETFTSYGAYASKTIMTFPNAVTGFSYSARTATAITLKWAKNTSASGYVIEQYKGGKWTAVKTIESNSTVSHKITGLSSGTAHQFRIRAYKLDGTTKVYGAYANKTVKTLPSAVKSFTFKARTASSITLKWAKNANADGYVIQQYKGGKWVTIKTITKNSTVTHKVTGLKAGTTYKFRIRTYEWDNGKKIYASSYTTKPVKTLPSTVKNFTYKTRTKASITLKWAKNTSADGYVIQQYKGGKWKTIKTISKNSIVSYKVTGLKKNTTYKFRIKAYKKDGSVKVYGSYATKSIKTL